MRAPISVIIPTLNAAAVLPACLKALINGVEAGLIREVIISDGQSDDPTVVIAQAWGAEMTTGPASRGGQLRRGCDLARGEWLLILHADTVLAPGWTGAVALHLNTDKAGYFRLVFDRGGFASRWVARWANLRSWAFGLPYGDQGLLIRRASYDVIGGYPDQPLMEDVAIACALRGRLARLDAAAITCADKYVAQGWMRRGARNLWTVMRYFCGVSPEKLARSYRQ